MELLSKIIRKYRIDVEKCLVIGNDSIEYTLCAHDDGGYIISLVFKQYAYNNEQRKYFDTKREVEEFLKEIPMRLYVKRYFERDITDVHEDVINDYALEDYAYKLRDEGKCIGHPYIVCYEFEGKGLASNDKIFLLFVGGVWFAVYINGGVVSIYRMVQI